MLKAIKENDPFMKTIEKAGSLLISKKNTIAVAESATSGNVQMAFSLAKDATRFFEGGITVYNIGQKCRHLLIEPTHAIKCNCVSKKIADQMALQVIRLFSSHYGIGITGYASPVPEQNIHKLFAHISIAKHEKIILSKKVNAKTEEPFAVQQFYAETVFKLLVTALAK